MRILVSFPLTAASTKVTMIYTIDSNGKMTCESMDICGSCRVSEHGLHNLMADDSLYDHRGVQMCAGCGKFPETITESQEIAHNGIHEHCRKTQVGNIAMRFGGIDGDHHKQWVIDQMLRSSLGKERYEAWIKEMNSDPDYDPWDVGSPP